MSLRVLMVEDNPTDAKLVLHALAQLDADVVHRRVETAEELRRALADAPWDIVLSDWTLPTLDALGALAIATEVAPDVPFVIVSGTVGEDLAADAMRAGARDYVLKDRLGRLHRAVAREVENASQRAAGRAAERALKESEARFRALAESGILGIVVFASDGTLLEANDTYLRMLGFDRADLTAGRINWMDRIPPENRELARSALESLERDGVVQPVATESLRKDGSRVSLLAGAAALDGSRRIAFVVDESERWRIQQTLSETESQLRHAQKMEAVGRLAGGIAHDFNNVLSVVLSLTELLLADLRDADPIRADVEEIQKAGMRAAALTRQLLLFSRQQLVKPEALYVPEVLADLERMLQRLVGEDVELVLQSDASTAAVLIDRGSIEQVVMNLVVNARDAMPDGGRITLDTSDVYLEGEAPPGSSEPRTGWFVRLRVTDDGCGMDDATLARIFEPFFTTKPIGRGTGLGLSTVFGMVSQAQGWVAVESAPGRGSTFTVLLPRHEGPVAKPHAQPAAVRGAQGRETVLVVEDEEQVRAITASALRRQGYEVLEARHGAHALTVAAQHGGRIDLLITDLVMPELGGADLARILGSERPEMRVLMVSGYTDDRVVRAEAGGRVPYLQKPITPVQLLRKVREILG